MPSLLWASGAPEKGTGLGLKIETAFQFSKSSGRRKAHRSSSKMSYAFKIMKLKNTCLPKIQMVQEYIETSKKVDGGGSPRLTLNYSLLPELTAAMMLTLCHPI